MLRFLDFGREVASHPSVSLEREWLVTNGIGGYASCTVANVLTRRYHGLLVAALHPPLGRTVLLSKVEETAFYNDRTVDLFSNDWDSAPVQPLGYAHHERFHLEGTTPVWTFALGDAQLEKRVWMPHGENTTCIRYTLRRGTLPLELSLKTLVNYRDFHQNIHAGDWHMDVTPIEHGLRIQAFEGATPFTITVENAAVYPQHEWYRDYYLQAEAYRGLDATGDHLEAGNFRFTLHVGESVTLVASTEANPTVDYAANTQRETTLIAQSGKADAPDWIQQLVLAADQFIVQRALDDNPEGRSIIAGYHWFGDWGRDTMISLPGLTLATGRTEEAALILRTYAQHVDQGMLPNRFPDYGDVPEYNTVDATLWYFEAIRAYVAATDDTALLRDIFPVLQDIITWHQRGTRYNIHVDPADGLLYSGEFGVQLTWMDAKVGDWVVTPRTGKAVEINALWYNALRSMADFAEKIGEDASDYQNAASQVQASFARYWKTEYCYDVLDTPAGDDASLRPNQLFAVSLHHSPLAPEHQKAVVDVCARRLLTSIGMRSLAPGQAGYIGRYGGGPFDRDSAYHQGTVWAWLIGPFVAAHYKVYGDAALAREFLAPFAHHLRNGGIGTITEVAEGDPPHTPRAAIAQAWSVAEILRVWDMTEE